MILKKGVRLQGIKPELLAGLMVVDTIYKSYDRELVITEIAPTVDHADRSDHNDGRGADLRTSYFPEEIKKQVFNSIKDALGDDFLLIEHTSHFHLGWRPKRL